MSVFRFFKSDNQNLYMQKRKARFQSSLNLLKDTKPRVATTKQNPHLSFGKEEPIPLYKSSYYHSQFLDLKPKVNKEAKRDRLHSIDLTSYLVFLEMAYLLSTAS